MNADEHRAWARERATEKLDSPEPELDRELDPWNSKEDQMEFARQRMRGVEFDDVPEWGDE